MRRGTGIDEVADSDSLQDIFNYFAGEIFSRASPEDRHILLHVSCLPRCTSHIAAALSESPNAPKLLEGLYRRHLFTDRRTAGASTGVLHPTVPARYIYQFHALFREFLLHQARETYAAKKLREIRSTAAALLEKEGQKEDALTLFVETQEWKEITRLICELATELLQQGRNDALIDHVRKVPQAISAEIPWLQYWLGMALAPNSWIESRKVLTQACAIFEQQDDVLGQTLAAAGAVQTFFYDYNVFGPLDPWLDMLERLVAQQPAFPSPTAELHVRTMVFMGMAHRKPWDRSQSKRSDEIFRLLASERDPSLRAFVGYAMLWWINQTHNWELYERLKLAIGPVEDNPKVITINRLAWMLQVGYFFHYSGRPSESIPAFERCESLNQASGLRRRQVTFWTTWGIAFDALRLGDIDRAEACVAGIDAALDRDRLLEVSFTDAVKAAIALHRGHPELAGRHFDRLV